MAINWIFVVGILWAIFICFYIGAEYEQGAIRNKIVVGHSRAQVYFSDLFLCSAVSAALMVGMLVCAGIAGYLFFPQFLFTWKEHLFTGELVLETVCVNGVLEETIAAFYGALTSRGIQPDIRITENRIERQLNREALGRVFSNILNNALKYSDGDLEIFLHDDGEIIFSNTASRLNEVQVGKLFDRFFTVEAARNSNGLGLAISKTLVEQMGGTIQAKLRDGRLHICIRFL